MNSLAESGWSSFVWCMDYLNWAVAMMVNMLGTKGQDTYKERVLSCQIVVTIRGTMGTTTCGGCPLTMDR